MASREENFIDNLTAYGKISFTLDSLCQELHLSYDNGLAAIKRLMRQKKTASPSKGYYLILTPEFRYLGCLPPNYFIDDLMRHLNEDYYVCLLSAAMYFGASHQKPQVFQVMLRSRRRKIRCGKVHINFIKNIDLMKTEQKKLQTTTGYMNVSTPEATAMELLKFMRKSGGLNFVATVIHELAEEMDITALGKLAKENNNSNWISRLGYLLELFNFKELAIPLYENLNKSARITPLVPYESVVGSPRNKKWRLAINKKVESDLDDSY